MVWSFAKQQQLQGSFPPENLEELKLNPDKQISAEDQLYFLEGLMDVGDKRAHTLLDTFHTPAAVISAIQRTTVEYTKGHKPKGIHGPLKEISGLGAQFVLANHELLHQGEDRTTS